MTSDLIELLNAFNAGSVRYLVVGGYAVIEYTEPRYTKDLDLWISTAPDNAQAVYSALQAFGAPLAGISPNTFADRDLFYQMGRPPLRVDILMSIPGVEFDEAWDRKTVAVIEGVEVPIIAKSDLIANKLASGRNQDLRDARSLLRSDASMKKRRKKEQQS